MTEIGDLYMHGPAIEAKPLKFSPPESLCGTVGSPWVSLASNLIWVLEDFDKIFRIDDFVWFK